MAVDNGQMEGGRSLGFTYSQTMRYIILPQAIKNAFPALGNEFITLLKGNFDCWICSNSRFDKGSRFYYFQNIRSFLSVDCNCHYLFCPCMGTDTAVSNGRKEDASK